MKKSKITAMNWRTVARKKYQILRYVITELIKHRHTVIIDAMFMLMNKFAASYRLHDSKLAVQRVYFIICVFHMIIGKICTYDGVATRSLYMCRKKGWKVFHVAVQQIVPCMLQYLHWSVLGAQGWRVSSSCMSQCLILVFHITIVTSANVANKGAALRNRATASTSLVLGAQEYESWHCQ